MSHSFDQLAIAVLDTTAQAIAALKTRVDKNFNHACELMLQCQGRIVVMGMGKSGHIGGKIAATLASTGTPAFFVHPGEASHGDMGMITSLDVVLAFSNSGETQEVLTLLPLIKRLGVPLISLTGNPQSSMARHADAHIDVSVEKEACPLGLAPTTSTSCALAMGDALAIALLDQRGFTADDFALSHPGGQLGRKLLLRVNEIMHIGDRIPAVAESAKLDQALLEMTKKGLGMTAVVDAELRPVGIFTDGDLRRVLNRENINIREIPITDVMTRNFHVGNPDMLAAESLQIMQQHEINGLPIINEHGQLIGAMNMHDLLMAGVM